MVLVVTAQIYANADPASIPRMQAKFAEASRTYLKDPGTLSWYVMQDQQDLRSFLIFEKYTDDEAFKTHRSNPYAKTVSAYVGPMLEKPMALKMYYELDTTHEFEVPK